MYSLNDDSKRYTHADFGGGTPLCGFSYDEEPVTQVEADVTCLDCLAAL